MVVFDFVGDLRPDIFTQCLHVNVFRLLKNGAGRISILTLHPLGFPYGELLIIGLEDVEGEPMLGSVTVSFPDADGLLDEDRPVKLRVGVSPFEKGELHAYYSPNYDVHYALRVADNTFEPRSMY